MRLLCCARQQDLADDEGRPTNHNLTVVFTPEETARMRAILTVFIANGPATVSIEKDLKDDHGSLSRRTRADQQFRPHRQTPLPCPQSSTVRRQRRTSNPHLPTHAELRQQLRDANREAAELVAKVQALLDEETTRRSLDTAKTAQAQLDSVLLRCNRLYAALGLRPAGEPRQPARRRPSQGVVRQVERQRRGASAEETEGGECKGANLPPSR